ncbi:hypothetical protein PIB30_049981 [Stylosanthes scabra]|uniref:RNase H type-1 domain-containing protein n=1 Tax=Stylosanthes scabra TaxID=79078 RepID=A0ABU6RHI2_9FABA|nr:hypothetical protein [Stylosanthes scabra]
MLHPAILHIPISGTALSWLRKIMTSNVCILATGVWWIWRSRCHEAFNPNDHWPSLKVVMLARQSAADFLLYRNYDLNSLDLHPSRCWKPPPSPFYKIKCDASVFQDKALAGFGCILRDSKAISMLNLPTAALCGSHNDLFLKIHELLLLPWVVKFVHVHREGNMAVDWLTRQGACKSFYYIEWLDPYLELLQILSSDVA